MVKGDSDLNDDQIEIDGEKHIKKAVMNESEDSEESALPMDPLVLTEEIVMKYQDFVDYIIQMLKVKEEEEEEVELQSQLQRWGEIVERGKRLVEDLNKRLKKVGSEMEWLKTQDYLNKEYSLRETNLPHIFAQLRDINSRLGTSPHIAVVSDIKNTNRKNVLSMCLDELEDSKQQLSDLMELIKVLKVIDTQEDDDDDDDDDEETE